MAQQGGVSGMKLVVLVLAFGFSIYILGPPLYWHFSGGAVGKHMMSCPLCICDCPNDSLSNNPLADLANVTLPGWSLNTLKNADCSKDDPDMQDELGKSRYQLLQEELKLQEAVAEESQQRSEGAFLDAKKIASQYQKEFEKCNSGMETSEGAREKAEAALVEQKKITEVWESRARALGWKEEESSTAKTESAENTETTTNGQSSETSEVQNTELRPDAKKLKTERSSTIMKNSRRNISSQSAKKDSS